MLQLSVTYKTTALPTPPNNTGFEVIGMAMRRTVMCTQEAREPLAYYLLAFEVFCCTRILFFFLLK